MLCFALAVWDMEHGRGGEIRTGALPRQRPSNRNMVVAEDSNRDIVVIVRRAKENFDIFDI